MTYDWASMTMNQLVTTYNEMVMSAIDVTGDSQRYRTVARFSDHTAAVRRCAQLHSDLNALYSGVKAEEKRASAPETTPQVSAGLSRLRAHPDAEAIRQKTLDEQAKAAAEVSRQPTQEEKTMTAKKTKKTKTPKAAKKAPNKAPGKRRDTSQQYITVYANYKTENPKRGTAAQRFTHYKDGMTVDEYIAKVGDRGLALADVRWDVKQGFIKLHNAKA